VGVAELTLDHVQRDALSGHFDGVCVAELVGREAAPNGGDNGQMPKRRADGGRRPRSTARRAVDDAQQRSDG
jgi:hypothetical protein